MTWKREPAAALIIVWVQIEWNCVPNWFWCFVLSMHFHTSTHLIKWIQNNLFCALLISFFSKLCTECLLDFNSGLICTFLSFGFSSCPQVKEKSRARLSQTFCFVCIYVGMATRRRSFKGGWRRKRVSHPLLNVQINLKEKKSLRMFFLLFSIFQNHLKIRLLKLLGKTTT